MKSRTVAVYSLYTTLFIILGFISFTGIIRIGPISFTIMALPVTVITIHKGIKGALFGLSMFGFTSTLSLIYAPEAPILLSQLGVFKSMVTLFLARVLIILPLGLYLMLIKNKKVNVYLNGVIITLIISISNTIFVLGFFSLFGWSTFYQWFALLILTNILPEWLIVPTLGGILARVGIYFKHLEQNIKTISW